MFPKIPGVSSTNVSKSPKTNESLGTTSINTLFSESISLTKNPMIKN